VIPPFTTDGDLPPGIHTTTWQVFAERFGGTAYRRDLLRGLQAALGALKQAGCRTVYIDGSFVTAKKLPGDFDVCWDVSGVDPALLDPIFLIFDRGRAAQKARFRGEFFPAQLPEGASGMTFLEFFQTSKETGRPKGIVALSLETLP
jgi:hypothetical protein